MTSLITLITPILVASYVGEKIWEHRRDWYRIPDGWRLPKVEVACLVSALGSLYFVALVLA